MIDHKLNLISASVGTASANMTMLKAMVSVYVLVPALCSFAAGFTPHEDRKKGGRKSASPCASKVKGRCHRPASVERDTLVMLMTWRCCCCQFVPIIVLQGDEGQSVFADLPRQPDGTQHAGSGSLELVRAPLIRTMGGATSQLCCRCSCATWNAAMLVLQSVSLGAQHRT